MSRIILLVCFQFLTCVTKVKLSLANKFCLPSNGLLNFPDRGQGVIGRRPTPRKNGNGSSQSVCTTQSPIDLQYSIQRRGTSRPRDLYQRKTKPFAIVSSRNEDTKGSISSVISNGSTLLLVYNRNNRNSNAFLYKTLDSTAPRTQHRSRINNLTAYHTNPKVHN
jgi:hypothetical protein